MSEFFSIINKIWERITRSEAGNVLVISLVASGVLIGVTGFAVDYGNAIVQESKLKQATDMAVLAGVQELPYTTSCGTKVVTYFQNNYSRANECAYAVGTTSDTCSLTATHQIPTHFMRVFGQDSLTVRARSKAKLESIEGFSGGIGIAPFVIVNPDKNSSPNDDLNASNNGKPYLLKYGPDNRMLCDWYYGQQQVAVGYEHVDDSSIANGGWRSVLGLDPDSTSPYDYSNAASDYKDNFAYGWGGTIEIGDILGSNPGDMVGPTTQGRNDRLNGNDTSWSGFDPNLDPTNTRILIVPVVSLGSYVNDVWQEASVADVAAGNYDWSLSRVVGFAAFFLLTDNEQKALPGGNDVDRKWVVGRFMYGVNIGGVLTSPGNSNGPNFGMKQGRLIPF